MVALSSYYGCYNPFLVVYQTHTLYAQKNRYTNKQINAKSVLVPVQMAQ